MSIQWNNSKGQIETTDKEKALQLPPYPIDMAPFLVASLDTSMIPLFDGWAECTSTRVAQQALAYWNLYLANSDENAQGAFLSRAYWLVEHDLRLGDDVSGWPIPFSSDGHAQEGHVLSSLTQGNAISVLIRAYRLTHEEVYLEVAHRAIRTFERDILDGGVSTPIGSDGVFFEEVAVYPAKHSLSGFIFALFGLYDYLALTGDEQVEKLITRSLKTMHLLLAEFDVGYWLRPNLLTRRLASPSHLGLQAMLLQALSHYSGCEHCSALASRWRSYQCQLWTRSRYFISSRSSSWGHALLKRVRAAFFPRSQHADFLRVCVPVTAFPVTGGIRAVLAKIALVTKDIWQIEYLTQYIGPHSEKLIISRFGHSFMSPQHFPTVWLYTLAGFCKLLSLIRHGANYHVILPQDGVFTGAFAAIVAKLVGIRVVCIDHGIFTLLESRSFREERILALATKNWSWFHSLLARLQYLAFWPSLSLLAHISARYVDHFLIPGVTGDGIEEVCKGLGIQTSRITRFATMIDIDRYTILDAASKANTREKNGIAADAIVIVMVCRLAPEKGIDIALKALGRALSVLSPLLQKRTRVVIAGDGPLRKNIEEDILKHGLSNTVLLRGEIAPNDVISLLGMSDIFLYTSIRGACLSMAVLEAMASGCAVIASSLPMANVHMLADGRGITVPPGDVEETGKALLHLLHNPHLCRRMGDLARAYVAVHHSPLLYKRTLMRTTYWTGSEAGQ